MAILKFKSISAVPLVPKAPPTKPQSLLRPAVNLATSTASVPSTTYRVPRGEVASQPIVLRKPSDSGVGFKRWATWWEKTGAEYVVVAEWGKEGALQRQAEYRYDNIHRAVQHIGRHVQGKLARGYTK